MMHRTAAATALAAAAFLAFHATAEAQGARPCSEATLRGGYGYTVTGTVSGQPFAATGRFEFDGRGGFDNVRTISQNGNISRNVAGDGTYTVGADCRGTVTFTQGGVVTLGTDLVVDDRGEEIRMIATSPGTVLTVTGRRQF